jgi:hypothetical protein
MPPRHSLVSVLAAILLGTSSLALGAERIDLILIGHVISSYNPVTTFLDPDPSVRYTVVPTSQYSAAPLSDADAKRYVKQYFPRTYARLAEHDFVMYSIPYIVPLTLKQISWLRSVVETGDAASLTDQGGLRLDVQYAEFWISVGMSDIFANDAEKVLQVGQVTYSSVGYRLKVNQEASHPVLLPLIPLGLEEVPSLGLFHTVPKEGAAIVAEAVGGFLDLPGSPRSAPWLMYYDYGEGFTWTLCDNFVNPFWCGMYYGDVQSDLQTDVLMNIIWHSVGLELPGDAALVHEMRLKFRDYIGKRSLQMSVIEFVDRLGANLGPVESRLDQADSARSEAEELYLEQDYEGSSERMSVAFRLLEEATELSLRQKKSALMWIYIIEWAAVTGTLMMCGAVSYTLMVRRRYYREVRTTRLV